MGRRADLDALLAERHARVRRRAARRRRAKRAGAAFVVVAGIAGGTVFMIGFGAGAALSSTCTLSSLQPVAIGSNSFVYAADGTLLGSIPAERNRVPVTLAHMSRWLPKASVAIEDRRFYQHGGIDYVGITRALWRDVSAGKVVEGGSTIDQQLVRNLYTGREQTLQRKLKEACLAIRLSHRWSKDRILATYLNIVYYGNHAYGTEAAAQTYFSRHARELNLPEAALIAGLTQAPSLYDPLHNPTAAIARRNEVLQAMRGDGAISGAQYRWAVAQPIHLRPGRVYATIKQPYFVSYVIDELERTYGANTVREGGLRVYTTIEPKLQAAANRAIRDTLYESNDPAAAIVSIEPGTGAIRAMTAVTPGNVGNQYNLAAQSTREAGSTFKPFVLAAAIEKGINPDTTTYVSAAFTCTAPECLTNGEPWSVSTYDHTYAGPISITNATLRSDNTVYAQLTLDVGPETVWKMARRLGVHLSQAPVASIGLGPLSVSPLDMASAYATFASGGIYARPLAIRKVILPGGRADRTAGWGRPHTRRVLQDGVAWKVNQVLAANAAYGTGAGSGDGIHPNAGKTGTTEDHADAWFDGYTRDLSTAVWMGYQSGEIPMLSVHGRSVAGATFPVPIWHLYMRTAEQGLPARPFPSPVHPPAFAAFTPATTFGTLATAPALPLVSPTRVAPTEPRRGRPVPAIPAPRMFVH
ncbi:MAG: transglycosylase domain-containing protein [Actinomycetes bacterium]